jgi:hypothetical protein
MSEINKKNLKKTIVDTIKEYDEQIDLQMSMIQSRPNDLVIRKNELEKLLIKLGIQ